MTLGIVRFFKMLIASIVLVVLLPVLVNAQSPSCDSLCIVNPSFEVPPGYTCNCETGACGTQCTSCLFGSCLTCPCKLGISNIPDPWQECMAGYTPDMWPNSSNLITLPPSHGNTYLGVYYRPNWQEAASQLLCNPMTAGKTYSFNLDLALAQSTTAEIDNNGCAEIVIWGAGSQCTQGEMLWRSGRVSNLNWQTYLATITPTANHTHFLIKIEQVTGAGCVAADNDSGPYIVVDNIKNVVVCNPTVTTTPSTICNGVCGTISATGASGTAPYTYTWSPAAGLSITTGASVTACPTTTTTYTVTARDNNGSGSSATATAVVTVNPKPTVSVTAAAICNGNSTTLTASGANTYTWTPTTGLSSGTGTSVSANPTTTSTYTIVGTTTATGCTNSTTVVVTVNPKPTVAVPPATICNGTSTTLTASGANTYTWSPATGLSSTTGTSVTANPTSTSTSTYTVVGTDGNGCTNSTTVVVTVNPKPTVTVPAATICANSSVTLTAKGASSYTWTPITGLSSGTDTSVTASPTVTTTYTVTGTDGNGCTNTTTVIVNVNPNPTVNASDATICSGSSTTLTASGASSYTWSPTTGLNSGTGTSVTANPVTTTTYTITGTTSSCIDSTTVIVTVNPIPVVSVPAASICPGGSKPLTASGANTYTWSPATGLSATTGTTVAANPSATTTYTVVGTSLGCTGSTTVVVTVGALVANAGPDVAICASGSVTLGASGGTVFSWTPATGLSNANISNPIANPTATTTYTVNVSDGSCSDDDMVIVTVNPNPVVSVPAAAVCNGKSTTLTASGATTYIWTPASGLSITTGSTVTANPVSSTTYTVTGSFATGCTGVTTVVVTVNPNPTVTVPDATICEGNSTSLTANGADTYTWAPAGGLSSTTGTAVNANPAVTSTYTVTGTTSATGCTGTATVVITVIPPCGPNVNATGYTVCNGICGTVTSTASGGTPPYSYLWNNGAVTSAINVCPAVTTTYTITVTDNSTSVGSASAIAVVTVNPNPVVSVPAATICNGSSTTLTVSGADTYSWSPATGLSATTGNPVMANPSATTTYTVLGTFTTGCTGVTTVVVTVNPIPVVTVPNASICPGGSTPLTASGATTYSWSPATGLSSTTGATVTANPSVTTTYTVCGTTNGCSSCTTVTVSVGALIANAGADAAICYGASTNLNATGGTIFTWTPATGLDNPNIANPIANPTVTTTYTVNVSDGNCSDEDEVILTVNPPINLNIAGFPTKCANGSDGQAVVIPNGGTPTYTYSWSPVISSNASVNGTPGSYSVIVIDLMGCTASASTVITNPTPVTGVSSVITANCNQADGSASATGSGGTGPYTYSWNTSPVQNTQTAVNIPAGAYIVTLTDANACTSTVIANVPNVPGVVASAMSTDVSCFNGNNGTATANASGGTAPYVYAWVPVGGNVALATGLTAGSYTVTITDDNGCTSTTSVNIIQPAQVVVNAANARICPTATANLNAGALGGTAPYAYLWNPGASTGNAIAVSPLVTTTYSVTATDNNGCTGITTVVVTVNPTPVISVPADSICQGNSTTLTAFGATSYYWSPTTGLNSALGSAVTANPLATTTYTITGTNSFGCTAASTVVLKVNNRPVLIPTSGHACPGDSIALSVSGANTYSWSPSLGLSSNTGSNVIATPPLTTVYTITGTGINGCSSATTITATVDPDPIANFTTSPETVDIFNPTFYFNDNSIGAAMWDWSFGDSLNTKSFLQNPTFTYPSISNFYIVKLFVTNQFGCIDSTTNTVFIRGIYTFYIPNTFTPNSDGTNDVFLPKGVGIDEEDYHLWIFDRWGNLIWETEIWGEGWDGKANSGANIAQVDTYVWKVHVKEKESAKKHNYIGHVNIVK